MNSKCKRHKKTDAKSSVLSEFNMYDTSSVRNIIYPKKRRTQVFQKPTFGSVESLSTEKVDQGTTTIRLETKYVHGMTTHFQSPTFDPVENLDKEMKQGNKTNTTSLLEWDKYHRADKKQHLRTYRLTDERKHNTVRHEQKQPNDIFLSGSDLLLEKKHNTEFINTSVANFNLKNNKTHVRITSSNSLAPVIYTKKPTSEGLDGHRSIESMMNEEPENISGHNDNVLKLQQFIESRKNNLYSNHYVCILHGPYGSGKTHIINKAAKYSAVNVVYLDLLLEAETKTNFKQYLVKSTGFKPEKTHLIVVEGIENDACTVKLLTEFLKSVVSSTRTPVGQSQTKLWLNPIVVVCENMYSKSIYRLKWDVKCVMDIKVLEPSKRDVKQLCKLACKLLSVPITNFIQKLVASSTNITYLLTQLQALKDIQDHSKLSVGAIKIDDRHLDKLGCVKYVLAPTGIFDQCTRKTTYTSFDEFSLVWDRGDNTTEEVFNSYTNFVSPPMSKTDTPELQLLGINQASAIADIYSYCDGISPGGHTDSISEDLIRRTVWATMKKTKGKPSRYVQLKKPKFTFPNSYSNHDLMDKYRHIHAIHQIEIDKKITNDYTVELSTDYMLKNHVGCYRTLTSDEKDYVWRDSLESIGPVNKKVASENIRIKMIPVLSHSFSTV